jgi:NitT/TauT family transport system substrate-binding protein
VTCGHASEADPFIREGANAPAGQCIVIQPFGLGRCCMPIQNRRRFLTNAALAGAAGLGGFGAWGKAFAAEPPPEITTIRFEKDTAACIAPQVFQELLRVEGFTDIRYVDLTEANVRRAEAANSAFVADMIAHGEVDFGRETAPDLVRGMNAGAPVTVLSGLHLGRFEIFGKNEIRTLGGLKGKIVGEGTNSSRALLNIMTSLIGLDPAKDIRWVRDPSRGPMDLFIEGKVDAFLAAPPDLQEVRPRNIGHVIVSSITDRPWSQYYCCMLETHTEFAKKYPVATKRVLRAILKATDFCVSDPKRAARLLVEQGYTKRYDYALQALGEIRYDVWREYDPEDTLRFYALRLHEAGLIQSSPNKLIAEHTDWRFLDEVKRELKA